MRMLKGVAVGVAGLVIILPARTDGVEKIDPRIAERVTQHAGASYVAKPIPCGPEAPTYWQYRQEKKLPFFRKQMIDPFKASSETNQPWASEVLRFLEEDYLNDSEASFMGGVLTWRKADALAQKGCSYPVVLWMQALDMSKKGKRTQALDALKKLDDRLAGSSGTWFQKFLVGVGYQTISPSSENERLLAARFAAWVASSEVTREDSRPVFGILCDLASDESRAILAALEKKPPNDPWLTFMLRGGVARKQACAMRCPCHSETPLTAEEIKTFREGVMAARNAYVEAWRSHPELPNAATMLIESSGCLGDEDLRLWFDRAVAVEIDRPKPYMSYIWFCRPRWGGSIEKLQEFAESCYQTQRHDTRVPFFYVITMFQIARELKCDLRDVFTRPGVHAKCIEVLEAQVKNTKATKDVRDQATELLPVVEYLGGDVTKALAYYQRLGKPLSKAVYELTPDECNHLKIILTGLRFQNGKALVGAEELYRAGRTSEALAALNQIPDAVLTSHEEEYFYYRKSCLEMETLFKRGEWVAPTFKRFAPSWLNFNMGWRLEGNGLRTDKESCQLEWMTPIPADVEYEGVIRFVAPAGQESGLCLQLDKFKDNHKPTIYFDYENNSCRVAVGGQYDSTQPESVSVACEKPEVRFRIVSCSNKVSVWVNGKQLINKQDITKYMQLCRANGMRHLTLYGTRVAISDLRMRAPDANAQ